MRRTRKIADHVIVFYLRCLKSGNKISLGYGFCEGCTKTYQLIWCIKEWLLKINACGLRVLVAICDQNSSNIAAINYLINECNKIRTMKNLPTSKKIITYINKWYLYALIILLLNDIKIYVCFREHFYNKR